MSDVRCAPVLSAMACQHLAIAIQPYCNAPQWSCNAMQRYCNAPRRACDAAQWSCNALQCNAVQRCCTATPHLPSTCYHASCVLLGRAQALGILFFRSVSVSGVLCPNTRAADPALCAPERMRRARDAQGGWGAQKHMHLHTTILDPQFRRCSDCCDNMRPATLIFTLPSIGLALSLLWPSCDRVLVYSSSGKGATPWLLIRPLASPLASQEVRLHIGPSCLQLRWACCCPVVSASPCNVC